MDPEILKELEEIDGACIGWGQDPCRRLRCRPDLTWMDAANMCVARGATHVGMCALLRCDMFSGNGARAHRTAEWLTRHAGADWGSLFWLGEYAVTQYGPFRIECITKAIDMRGDDAPIEMWMHLGRASYYAKVAGDVVGVTTPDHHTRLWRWVHARARGNAERLVWCARYHPRGSCEPSQSRLLQEALVVDADYVPAYAVMLATQTMDEVHTDTCLHVLRCTDRMLVTTEDLRTARDCLSRAYMRRNVGWTPGTHGDWMYTIEGATTNELFGALMLGLNRLHETGVLVGRHDFVTECIISDGVWVWSDTDDLMLSHVVPTDTRDLD